MVAVFREVRRVLRDDGVLWLNLGDSYAHSGGGDVTHVGGFQGEAYRRNPQMAAAHQGVTANKLVGNLKPKDLVGMPWRLALALQADGWYLRSDIIWAKGVSFSDGVLNYVGGCMPESVTDRPTKSHEHMFLLTKQARYFFDSHAVREGVGTSAIVEAANFQRKRLVFFNDFRLENAGSTRARSPSSISDDWLRGQVCIAYAATILNRPKLQCDFGLASLDPQIREQLTKNDDRPLVGRTPVRHWCSIMASLFLDSHITAECFLEQINRFVLGLSDGDTLRIGRRLAFIADSPSIVADCNAAVRVDDASEVRESFFSCHNEQDNSKASTLSTRNLRDVWTIPTEAYAEAHFATFPRKLVAPCLKAGTSAKGCCPECGAPWVRVIESERKATRPGRDNVLDETGMANRDAGRHVTEYGTVGWKPGCECTELGNIADEDPGCQGLHDGVSQIHATPVPCVVADIFMGSGTVGVVAKQLGLDFIGIELNPEYVCLARKRIENPEPEAAIPDVPGQIMLADFAEA